jgi:hypothetical protein
MTVVGFLALAVVGLTPAFLAGWLDPKSRRRRERARREVAERKAGNEVGASRSRLSESAPGVWRERSNSHAYRPQQQDENASI